MTTDSHRPANSARTETREGRLGEHLVCRDVWNDGIRSGHAVLQAGFKVRLLFCINSHRGSQATVFSIQTWALEEAKKRMEARGEKYKYEPSDSKA